VALLGRPLGRKGATGRRAQRLFLTCSLQARLHTIDKETRLATDLAGLGVKREKQDRICLESKEEMEKRSLPDDGDVLGLLRRVHAK
jgi:hypothetical protein